MTRAAPASPSPEMQDRIDEVLLLVFRRLQIGGGRKLTSSAGVAGLWQSTELSTQANIGTALKAAYHHGFLEKISTRAPKAAITRAGYARLVELYRRVPLLGNLTGLTGDKKRVTELAQRIIDDLGRDRIATVTGEAVPPNPRPSLVEMDFAEIEPRVLASEEQPRMTDEEFEQTLLKRSQDQEQVDHAVAHLRGLWCVGDGDAITSFLTPLEIIKADFETLQHGANGYWSREFSARRWLDAADDRPRSLGEMGDRLGGLPTPLKGVDKIAAGLEIQRLADEGQKRGLPGQTTLGEVHDRLEAERISGIEPIPGWEVIESDGRFVTLRDEELDKELVVDTELGVVKGGYTISGPMTVNITADTSDVVRKVREDFRLVEQVQRWRAAAVIMAAGALALGFAIGVLVMP